MSEWGVWTGRVQEAKDVVTPGLVKRYCATFDRETDTTPLGLHWCLCLPEAPTANLSVDGHPARGEFLPPIPLPRRMWAASEVEFRSALKPGDTVRRRSRIAAVEEKVGGSGPLIFVALDHEIWANETRAVLERQTLVYKDASLEQPARKPRPAEEWSWRRTVEPGTPLLMRYSALTFNAHRIHYDRRYATMEEGYEDIVVQGPLTASLLLDLLAREGKQDMVTSFSFRAEAPAYVGRSLHLCGRKCDGAVELAVMDDDGVRVMSAWAKVS